MIGMVGIQTLVEATAPRSAGMAWLERQSPSPASRSNTPATRRPNSESISAAFVCPSWR